MNKLKKKSGRKKRIKQNNNFEISDWAPFEAYNELNSNERAVALKKLGIKITDKEVLGQLTKSHFVIPGKTKYECQQCGECCKYARKSAMLTYEPCPFLGDDNLCSKHNNHYQVCKWFPFWVYPDKKYGNLLTIKPYCSGYGKGDKIDYKKTVKTLLDLRKSSIKDPDGAEVIHEVISIPGQKEWAFPSTKKIDELMIYINKNRAAFPTKNNPSGIELAHARKYTSGLLGSINHANITVNKKGIITDMNSVAASMMGISDEQLGRVKITDFFIRSEKVLTLLNRCFALGKVTGSILKISNGELLLPVLCNSAVYRNMSDGLVHSILIVLRPISEDVYNELEQSQNYARELIESSPDMMVAINFEGKITDVNNATTITTGKEKDTLIGSYFKEYFSEPEMAEKGIKLALKNKRVTEYNLELISSLKKTIPVSFSASAYYDTHGTVQGVFAIARKRINF